MSTVEWGLTLPSFPYIWLYSALYLALKVFNIQKKWPYLSFPMVFYGEELEAHSRDFVYTHQWSISLSMFLSVHWPWTYLSFPGTHFDSWHSKTITWHDYKCFLWVFKGKWLKFFSRTWKRGEWSPHQQLVGVLGNHWHFLPDMVCGYVLGPSSSF